MKPTDTIRNMEMPQPKGYPRLLSEIKERIRSAQYEALKVVNKQLVGLYWDIGEMIVERQEKAGWGKAVVEQLAADLRAAFPGVGGFSASNLWRMKAFFEAYTGLEKLAPLVREIGWSHNLAILERCKDPLQREFYLLYRDDERVQPLVAQIGWSHNLVILQRCKDPLAREFYLRMTRKFGWSKNVLIHQIDNRSYEKSLLAQTNFDQALTPELRAQANLAVKDAYTFDFLELGETHSERELERALIVRIEDFLRAMGGMFAPALHKKRWHPIDPILDFIFG